MYSYRLLCNIPAIHSMYCKHSMPIISSQVSCVMPFPCFPVSSEHGLHRAYAKARIIKKRSIVSLPFPSVSKEPTMFFALLFHIALNDSFFCDSACAWNPLPKQSHSAWLPAYCAQTVTIPPFAAELFQ